MARLALAWPSKRTKGLPRQLLSRTRKSRSSTRPLAQRGLSLGAAALVNPTGTLPQVTRLQLCIKSAGAALWEIGADERQMAEQENEAPKGSCRGHAGGAIAGRSPKKAEKNR